MAHMFSFSSTFQTFSAFRSCISLSCPHLFRYVASCLILQKRLKHLMKDCPWRKSALLHVIHVKDVAGEGTEVKQFSLRSSHVSMFGGHRLDHPARVYCKLASMCEGYRGWYGMRPLKILKVMPASSGLGGLGDSRHKERQDEFMKNLWRVDMEVENHAIWNTDARTAPTLSKESAAVQHHFHPFPCFKFEIFWDACWSLSLLSVCRQAFHA
jgi:hypothetical protein